MSRAQIRKAFTLIELLVVIAIIALLVSILLPSLQGAREQGKKAVCLANLRQIAQAAHSYANDDETEMIVPIFWMEVREEHKFGFSGTKWAWRTALHFAFGGRTSQKEFPGASSPKIMMNDWTWGAARRPMNKYVYGAVDKADFKKLKLFQCPADTGYSIECLTAELFADDPDAPVEAAGISCYDFLGNSYRVNTCGAIWIAGTDTKITALSSGAEGHKATNIDNPSRTALFPEPMWYFWSRPNGAVTPGLLEQLMLPGWHKKIMTDNTSFCDGSARTVRVDTIAEFKKDVLDAMDYTPNFDWAYFLRRGKTWQTDCYRAPGAMVGVYDKDGKSKFSSIVEQLGKYTGWPVDGFTINKVP